MKYKLLVVLLIVAALAGMSCKKRDSKLPDPNAKVPEYATIAPTKVMFLALSKAELDADLSQAKIEQWTPVKDELDRASFSWGVLVANAQMHVLNKKPNQLKYTMDKLIMLTPILKLEIVGEKLSNDVLPKIAKADWQWLQTAVYSMQSEVDRLMNEREDFQHYTLIKLGEWTQATLTLAAWASKNSEQNFTKILVQPEAWNSIAQNLTLLSKKAEKPVAYFTRSQVKVGKIQDINKSAAGTPLTAEQLSQMASLTSDIKSIFSQIEQ